jgi:DNA-binding NarL/FixJ family response regulator
MIRVLIADDHRQFRQGLLRLLELIPDVEGVGEAGSGDEALQQAHTHQPDVILMDLHMPGTNGIEATRQLRETSPHIGILVLTMFEDDESVFAAMRAGARGYLLKGADREEIGRALTAVSHGEAIFSPSVAQRLMQYFATPPSPAQQSFPELTDREREVLQLIGQGLSNNVIAQRLLLSPKTVRNHVSRVFTKLQVADRGQAIIRARDAGIGTRTFDQSGQPAAQKRLTEN